MTIAGHVQPVQLEWAKYVYLAALIYTDVPLST